MPSKGRRRVGLALLLTAVSLATVAVADTNQREDWDCPHTPGVWCTNGGIHSYGSSTAINSADAYRKCAALVIVNVTTIAQVCAYLTEVRTQTNDGSFTQVCPYPNDPPFLPPCQDVQAWVYNWSGVSHGLRGVAWW